jgi:hypothetical protein
VRIVDFLKSLIEKKFILFYRFRSFGPIAFISVVREHIMARAHDGAKPLTS